MLSHFTLRTKALAGIALALGLFILAFSWVLSSTLMRDFRRLQENASIQQVHQVLQRLEQAGRELVALLYNYSCWTVTFDYAQGNGPTYWEDNYQPLLFQENTLDAVMVFDLQGRYHGGRSYDRAAQTVGEPSEALRQAFRPESQLLAGAIAGQNTYGFVAQPDGVLLAGARPIFRDDGTGPSAGVLVFARELSPEYLGMLSAVSGVSFGITAGDPQPMPIPPGATGHAHVHVIGGSSMEIWEMVEGHRGLAQLRDIYGQPTIRVAVELPTAIFQEAARTRRDILWMAVLGSIIVGLIALWLVEVLVLQPLRRVGQDVSRVTGKPESAQRLPVHGRDEFSALAGSVNHMLDALQESEHRYSLLAEVSPVGMFQTDAQGNCSYVNHRCCEILGREATELHGRGLVECIAEQHRRRVLQQWLGTGPDERFSAEFQVTAGDGGLCWVLGQATPQAGPDGVVTGYVGTFTDISERIRLEEEQAKVSKLESIGVLAGGIAHDFRNLLTPILCNISLARIECQDPEVAECLRQAENAVMQTNELTEQLLTFSRGGAPKRRSTLLPDLLRDSTRLALSGSSINCEFQIADDLWPVEVDPHQLSRVLQNMVINSAQAMPQGGLVKVSATNVREIKHSTLRRETGRFILIEVSDTGSGISPEDLGKIFDPYFTTKASGNGLGLATAFSIIRQHQGKVGVVSQVGAGTTFSIYLPATEKQPELLMVTGPEPEPGTGRVLVLDDDVNVLSTLRTVLGRLGYRVETALTGEEAIEQYRQALVTGDRFSAVILDLTVKGGMGGKETMPHLLKLDPHVRGIVASGYSDDPVLAHFREYGFCETLPKPYNVEQVSSMLLAVTGGAPLPTAMMLDGVTRETAVPAGT